MRRISLFFLCIGVVTMSCEEGGYVGNCVNNALLGEVGCQCVTPDNAYSRLSKGYLDPELDDLHYCADSKQPYYQSLNDSEIYVCNSYRCGVKACGSDEIPDADRRTCIKKAVCKANEAQERQSRGQVHRIASLCVYEPHSDNLFVPTLGWASCRILNGYHIGNHRFWYHHNFRAHRGYFEAFLRRNGDRMG